MARRSRTMFVARIDRRNRAPLLRFLSPSALTGHVARCPKAASLRDPHPLRRSQVASRPRRLALFEPPARLLAPAGFRFTRDEQVLGPIIISSPWPLAGPVRAAAISYIHWQRHSCTHPVHGFRGLIRLARARWRSWGSTLRSFAPARRWPRRFHPRPGPHVVNRTPIPICFHREISRQFRSEASP